MGVRELAQEAQPSDLYPYARKPDTWVQKRLSKIAKTVFLLKKLNQEVERAGLINKKCLGGYFDLLIKTYRDFLFLKKKVSKNYKC